MLSFTFAVLRKGGTVDGGFAKKGTNFVVSTSIYGGIGTPLVTQQPTWWFKVHLSRKAHDRVQCWSVNMNVDGQIKLNVELSLIKLKSKVLTIALGTTKLNCKI